MLGERLLGVGRVGYCWEMGGLLDLGQENPENLPGYPHELCPIPYRLW